MLPTETRKIRNMNNMNKKSKAIFVLTILITLTPPISMAQEKGDLYKVLSSGHENNSAFSEVDPATPATANVTSPDSDSENTDEQDTSDDTEQQKTSTIRDEAFKQLLNKTIPLKPEQIIELHKHLDKSQKAVHTPPTAPPQPISSTITIDLSPGATPPVIRLATGFVTSLVFVDSTGQPWPVVDYSLGNPSKFNIQWDRKTNALFIQSMETYVTANLAVRLGDLDTPIMLSLVSGQKEVDYRIDLQIRAPGPNALPPVVDSISSYSAPPSLLSVLDGVPPTGSTELKVSGNYGRAWLHNGSLIFRTKLTILSPAWKNSVTSLDGTKVYELMETPLILASQQGKPVHIELSGM